MKKNLGPVNALYPMPTVIIGTEVDGRDNYILIAHVGIVDMTTLSISMGKRHYSNQGIKQNRTLSINFFTPDMVIAADHVGMVSGADTDKSQVFESFHGELKGAPMVQQALLTMECEVVEIIDRPQNDVFFVQPVNTYCEEAAMKEGKIDFSAVNPVLFDMPLRKYWKLGEAFEDCWSAGKAYRKNP